MNSTPGIRTPPSAWTGSITTAATVEGDSLHLLAESGRKLLPAILEAAERLGVSVNSVEVIEPDLEAVFLHLTGTALRD